tara:strand:- start:2607 stop:2792 length:186 start_codon:yes stop_codon:yes gene_type:complete
MPILRLLLDALQDKNLIDNAKITYSKKSKEEIVTIVFSDNNSRVSDQEVNLWFETNDKDSN